MFTQFNLDFSTNLFDELSNSIEFENIANGRMGANLFDLKENNLIPLVRTTTVYKKPSQKFLLIHLSIIEKINKMSNFGNIKLNNALIEIYDSKYTNMKLHSDQSLDLEPNSYICIFSCYSNPESKSIRKLKVKEKNSGSIKEYILNHNSVTAFSLETNQKHLHKIILENNDKSDKNKWLGITFRLSKTYINFINEVPYFYQTKTKLRLANDTEKKEFYKFRSEENQSIHFEYPFIEYTICHSDLIEPI